MSHRHDVKRIAILFEYGTLNGGERSMLAVLDRLAGRPFEFVAIVAGEGRLTQELRQRGVRCISVHLRDARGVRLPQDVILQQLQAAITACSPDVVHANSLAVGRLTGVLAARLGIPCVSHVRDIVKLSRTAVDDLNRNCLLLAVSHATKAFHVQQGVAAGKVRVVQNGVDCEEFRPRRRHGWLHSELGLAEDSFLIATIGQIGLRKGQDVLARAAVLAARRLPQGHYVIVGERYSSKRESVDFERNLVQQFEQAGLANHLHRLGYREDVPQLLNEVDLLVHPAQQEPLGRVLLEAAASGRPIVATDVGGTSEILQDGVSALLVPPNDPESLATSIVAMHENSTLRQRLANEARSVAVSKFPIDRAADEHARIWAEFIG